MEILYTQEYSETASWVIFVLIIVMVTTIGLITFSESKVSAGVGLLIGILVMTVLIHINTIDYLEHGAIITDYNEVIEQGYEVVEQKGEITIIRKEVDEEEADN